MPGSCDQLFVIRLTKNIKSLFHTMSGVADLLLAACVQSDQLDPEQIAADVAAMAACFKPTK